jgi:uncharacterized protein
MENHARYGEFIYTHTADSLSVNLFMASELQWPERGLALRQETRFPEEAATTLLVAKAPADPITLRIRHPFWIDAARLPVTINGESVATSPNRAASRKSSASWQAGDRVHVALPMKLRIVRQTQCPGWVSIFNGPILLSGRIGCEGLERKDFIGPYTPIKAFRSLNRAPLFVAHSDDGSARPDHPGARPPGQLPHPRSGQAVRRDALAVPTIHFQRYAIYWQLSDSARAAELQREGRRGRAPRTGTGGQHHRPRAPRRTAAGDRSPASLREIPHRLWTVRQTFPRRPTMADGSVSP